MKNLKKVLALGLALVMLLGMFTVASAAETKKVATDFPDWATVEHKDAVSLMVDLGIINGQKDGTFNPKGTIDRASWAKMVYYAATGSDDADAYLGTATNLKDIAGNWAESYICYLSAMKYISGDNYGNYNPASNVTVAEANKMMLTVLGWDAEDRGYQNDAAWSGNIMTDAKREGLMDNVDRAQTALVPLTRENAAEIVYNALQTRMVEGEKGRDNGEKFIVKYNRKGYSLGYDVFGLTSENLTVKELKDGKAIFVEPGSPATNLNEKVSASLSDVGKIVTVFYKGTAVYKADGSLDHYKFDECVSSRVAQADSTAVKVITGGVDWTKTFNEDEEDDYCGYQLQSVATGDNYKTVTYYVNGEYKAAVQPTTAIKAGNVVELYDFKDAAGDSGSDGKIDTIKVYEYSVKVASGDTETRTSSGKAQVRVPGVTSGWKDAETVEGAEGIVKDDVVLTYSNAGNTVITKAEKVTGKITAKDQKNKVTVGGELYAQSELTPSKIGDITTFTAYSVSDNKDNEYDFFLDKNGDVCYAKMITEGTDKSKVAIVLDAWENFNGSDGSSVSRTKLLFVDGTVETVDVAKLDGDKITSDNAATKATALKDKAEKAFYNYKVDSNGKYELTEMKDDASATDDDWHGYVTAEVTADSAIDQKPTFTEGHSANGKTLFIVAKGNDDDGYTYYTYTSFENVPKMEKAAGVAITEESGKPAKYVYLKTESFTGDGTEGLHFLIDDTYSIDIDGNYSINVVTAEGVHDKLLVSEDVATELGFGSDVKVETFFVVKNVNDKDVVTKVELKESGDVKTLTSIGSSTVKVEGAASDTAYDKSTVFVLIDFKVKDDSGKDGIDTTTWEFDACGSFDPDNLEIEAENDGAEDPDKAFDRVVCIIDGETDKPADFVYVVRYANDSVPAPAAD